MTQLDAFGRPIRLPPDLSRKDRLAMLHRACTALAEGRLPEAEDRLFLAHGFLAYAARGGDLIRDYWRIAAPRGSHWTPQVLAARLIRDERQDASAAEDCGASSIDEQLE